MGLRQRLKVAIAHRDGVGAAIASIISAKRACKIKLLAVNGFGFFGDDSS